MEKYNFKTKTSTHLFDDVEHIVFGATAPAQGVTDEEFEKHLSIVKVFDRYMIGIAAEYAGKVTILKIYDDGQSGKLIIEGRRVSFSLQCDGAILYLSNQQ